MVGRENALISRGNSANKYGRLERFKLGISSEIPRRDLLGFILRDLNRRLRFS